MVQQVPAQPQGGGAAPGLGPLLPRLQAHQQTAAQLDRPGGAVRGSSPGQSPGQPLSLLLLLFLSSSSSSYHHHLLLLLLLTLLLRSCFFCMLDHPGDAICGSSPGQSAGQPLPLLLLLFLLLLLPLPLLLLLLLLHALTALEMQCVDLALVRAQVSPFVFVVFFLFTIHVWNKCIQWVLAGSCDLWPQ